MAKVRLRFRRRTTHVPNLMHILSIDHTNYILPTILHFRAKCAKGLHSTNKAEKEARACSFCFKNTKYARLTYGEYFCTPCSVFESDEDVCGWKAGSVVAYCEKRKNAGKGVGRRYHRSKQ